jgi:uncharacterized membrane protein YpjA
MRTQLNKLFSWRPFFYILLAINLYAAIYGFWWYRHQFAETPYILWPFVPNSPIPVLYFFFVLIFLLRGKRSPLLEGLAYFGLIKHGLWTVAIITVYQLTGRIYPENFMLWGGHLAMAIQAVLFWTYYGLPLTFPIASIIAGWYFFNDYLDYVVGIYPRVDTAAISVASIRTLALTYSAVLTIAFFYTAWRRKRKETL